MLVLSAIEADTSTVSMLFNTVVLSPVRLPSSVLKIFERSSITRASAGTLSPTRSLMMSPGTRSAAGMSYTQPPLRNTEAVAGCSFFKASSELSADRLCNAPTTEFSTKIARITNGSVYACTLRSMYAITADSTAMPSMTWTNLSPNCSTTSARNDLRVASGNVFVPYRLRPTSTCLSVNP
jgi:hypothetical protein